MSSVKKLSGELVATGPVVYHGVQSGGAEPGSVYDYIRLENSDGQESYLERVTVPAFLDSLIGIGKVATLYVAEVRIPTLFSSAPMHFVYAVEVDGKVRKATEQVQKILRSIKGGVVTLFLLGLVLLPAWGAGLLFWIRAFRLIKLSLPLDEMRNA